MGGDIARFSHTLCFVGSTFDDVWSTIGFEQRLIILGSVPTRSVTWYTYLAGKIDFYQPTQRHWL